MKGLAFVFPGQGSQYVGMGKELAQEFPIAQRTFAEANDALGFDLTKLCFEGGIEELTKTENTQPAILTASIAAFRVFIEEFGIKPEYVAGHSLGEYSALVAAGALDFADALQAVQKRGRFMQEAVPLGVGKMMAVMKLPREKVEAICREVSTEDKVVVPANYNSAEQIVISGDAIAVEEAGARLEAEGATIRSLQVSAPFHSPLMQPAAERMKAELKQLRYKSLAWPVISNVTAKAYSTTEHLLDNLTTQITAPVRWQETMEFFYRHGITRVIELGCKNVLQNLFKRSFPNIEVLVLEKPEEVEKLKGILPYKNYALTITKAIAAVVCTRNCNENQTEYEEGVIKPYKKLQELQVLGGQVTEEQALQALELLSTIFKTKKVPLNEQLGRFEEILEGSGVINYLGEIDQLIAKFQQIA